MKKFSLGLIFFFFLATLGQAAPLPAEQAFTLEAKSLGANTVLLHWQIKPGYFLYKDKIKITSPQLAFDEFSLPTASREMNILGKKTAVYQNEITLKVKLQKQSQLQTATQMEVSYQGCSQQGFCFPPQERRFQLEFNPDTPGRFQLSRFSDTLSQSTLPASASQSDKMLQLFSTHHGLTILLLFFGFGLLLAFTPCVLPMIPVLSGIIVGQSEHLTKTKTFLLSLSYVLSMSLTYALIGASMAVLGNNLQVELQKPGVLLVFSFFFILLASSMFDLYVLRFPQFLQKRLNPYSVSTLFKKWPYLGAISLGALSTLILSPCVTPPLLAVLTYIAQSQDIIFGVSTLFCLGLGMGAPLLILASSAGNWLPKAGPWMEGIKAFFGFLLLGVACSLLERLLPFSYANLLWVGLFIFAGLYAGAFSSAKGILEKLRKVFACAALVYGGFLLVSNSLIPFFMFLTPNKNEPVFSTVTVHALPELEKKLAQAHKNGQPLVLDFYADWCTSCKGLEKKLLRDPKIQEALKSFSWIKIDISANQVEQQALLKAFEVLGPPSFLFFDKTGKEERTLRLVGSPSTQDFLTQIEKLKDKKMPKPTTL